MKQAVKITRKDASAHSLALQAIQLVLEQCYASQQEQPDLTVGEEITALETLSKAVGKQWPLPEEITSSINLGPVAARNISDWNPALADSLMKLDYGLRLDTETLAQLIQTLPSMAYAKAVNA